jgi:hypothetical protein
MESAFYLIFILGAFIAFVLIMRFLGSWMLRIDEIITNQSKALQQMDEIRSSLRQIEKIVKSESMKNSN